MLPLSDAISVRSINAYLSLYRSAPQGSFRIMTSPLVTQLDRLCDYIIGNFALWDETTGSGEEKILTPACIVC